MRFIRSFKLSDWCLRVIIDNLDLFIYNENIPRKHIDFLFRLYSQEIYHRCKNQISMTEEHTLWFLNPYNKKVTLWYMSENVIKRLQVVGSGITSLTLCKSLASEWILNSVVCCIPNVTYLDLSSSHCTDSTLLCIQKMCPNVETLKIKGCRAVTDRGLKYLHGNCSIKNLNINYCNIGQSGLVAVLQGIPSLQYLGCDRLSDFLYYMHEKDLETGTYKTISYNLSEFVLYNYEKALEITWAWTVLCPNVKKVSVNFPADYSKAKPSVLCSVLDMCKNFKKLEELEIHMFPNVFNSTLARISLSPILHFSNNITKLILIRVEISIVPLLENFKNLKVLYLKWVYFLDFKQETIKVQGTKLETLTIKCTDIEYPPTYRSIVLLISLSKNVTCLSLNSLKNLPQELLDVIKNSMQKLIFVDFSFSIVKLNSINCFFEMPSLRIMYCDLCIDSTYNAQKETMKSRLSENYCTLSWRLLTDDDYDYDIFSNKIP